MIYNNAVSTNMKNDTFINKATKDILATIVVFSAFSVWLLGFLFEPILFVQLFGVDVDVFDLTLIMIFTHGIGFLFWIFTMTSAIIAKRILLGSIGVVVLFGWMNLFDIGIFRMIGYILSGFIISGTIVSSAYFIKFVSTKKQRFMMVAGVLVMTHILLMIKDWILLIHGDLAAYYFALSMIMISLLGAFYLSSLPIKDRSLSSFANKLHNHTRKDMLVLSMLIFFITINGGLLMQFVFPSYHHLGTFVGMYWLWPYVLGVVVFVWLFRKFHRGNLVNISVALIGMSLIGYLILPQTMIGFLLVMTLLMLPLGALDLFWWGTLGEMIEYTIFPGKIFGMGLFANVMGVFVGSFVGLALLRSDDSILFVVSFALTSVFVVIMLYPLISQVLSQKGYLAMDFSDKEEEGFLRSNNPAINEMIQGMSSREQEIIRLLCQGKTYKMIAEQLHISINTVKFHIKGIYGKFDVTSRFELLNLLEEGNEQT